MPRVRIRVRQFAETIGSFVTLTAWLAFALMVVLFALAHIPALKGVLPWSSEIDGQNWRIAELEKNLTAEGVRIHDLEKVTEAQAALLTVDGLAMNILQKSQDNLRHQTDLVNTKADFQWCSLLGVEIMRPGVPRELIDAARRRCEGISGR